MKALFCKKCHKRVIPPSFMRGDNLKVENAITIKCADPKCTGSAKYKPAKKEEVVTD